MTFRGLPFHNQGVRVFTPEYNFVSVGIKVQFFSFRIKVQFLYYQSVHFIIWPNENDIMALRVSRQNPRLPITSGVSRPNIGSIADRFKWYLRWSQDTNKPLKPWNGVRDMGWGCPSSKPCEKNWNQIMHRYLLNHFKISICVCTSQQPCEKENPTMEKGGHGIAVEYIPYLATSFDARYTHRSRRSGPHSMIKSSKWWPTVFHWNGHHLIKPGRTHMPNGLPT